MTEIDVIIIASAIVAFGLVSRRLGGTPLTAPMVFVAVGFVIGTAGLDLLDLGIGSSGLRLVAEVTLAFTLFADAALLDPRRLRREGIFPVRLLGVALPLTIVAGTVVAVVLFPDLVLFEAAALAVLLAPTDAALGQSIVTDTRLPSVVRQGLNVESGLNDGVCVPLLVAALTFAELEEAPTFDGQVLVDLVKELAVATVVGAVVAGVVAYLTERSEHHGWIQESWNLLLPLATAAVAYAATDELGGSGFIACFVAGLVYGRIRGEQTHQAVELTEDLGQLLSAVTFLLFGAVMIDRGITDLDWRTVLYAVLSLTVIRMVPVALSLIGSGAGRPTVAMAGWFGPRGLATIVFALTVVEESGLDGTARILDVAIVTVLFSVVAHGVSAPGLIDRYVGWLHTNRNELTFEAVEVEVSERRRGARAATGRRGRQ